MFSYDFSYCSSNFSLPPSPGWKRCDSAGGCSSGLDGVFHSLRPLCRIFGKELMAVVDGLMYHKIKGLKWSGESLAPGLFAEFLESWLFAMAMPERYTCFYKFVNM